MSQLHAHLIVHGRVQGVGFRFMTQMKANDIGVFGYVRNQEDGTVEVEVEGEADKVYRLIDEVKKGVSPSAHVTHVDIDVSEELIGYTRFRTTH